MLHPLTLGVSKQLLPVYNKPMIYYPLTVLMLAGIRDILIITTPHEQPMFQRLLKDGSDWGVNFSYAVQDKPRGIAEAFIIGADFIGNSSVCLILGDNIFYGNHLGPLLDNAVKKTSGATLFGYEVKNPQRYGVAEVDIHGRVLSIEEKPKVPKSHIAVTGLYFYDNDVIEIAKHLKPSGRNELEITDVNNAYIDRGDAYLNLMGRGFTWLDAGTYESLMQANQFVQVIEDRQGLIIAAPEEVAYRQGFISREELETLAQRLGNNAYSQYLTDLAARDLHLENLKAQLVWNI